MPPRLLRPRRRPRLYPPGHRLSTGVTLRSPVGAALPQPSAIFAGQEGRTRILPRSRWLSALIGRYSSPSERADPAGKRVSMRHSRSGSPAIRQSARAVVRKQIANRVRPVSGLHHPACGSARPSPKRLPRQAGRGHSVALDVSAHPIRMSQAQTCNTIAAVRSGNRRNDCQARRWLDGQHHSSAYDICRHRMKTQRTLNGSIWSPLALDRSARICKWIIRAWPL